MSAPALLRPLAGPIRPPPRLCPPSGWRNGVHGVWRTGGNKVGPTALRWGMKHAVPMCVAMLAMALAATGQTGLLVSELMYQPRSGEAEWVELYNNGEAEVELADYRVVRWVADSMGKHYDLPQHSVGPHEFVVLTADVASVVGGYDVRYADRLVECQLPPYPNGGGIFILCTADSTVVERFEYSPSMHSRLLSHTAGVSLERRRYDRPASEAKNWTSAASASGFGTPGYANSQSAEALVLEADFRLGATLLSPDGDGYQDELVVDYRLPDGDLGLTVEVYDGRGERVRHLVGDATAGTGGQLVWDGRDDDGRLVARGQYVLLFTVYNPLGTRQVVKRAVAVL